MAIEVKHSGSAATTAVAAYGGGQAQRLVQDTPQLLKLREQNLNNRPKERERVSSKSTLDERQRAEYNKRSQAYNDAKASGDFSDDELKEIRRRVVKQQLGLKDDLPLSPKNVPWTPEQAPGKTWTDPNTGATFTREHKTNNVKNLSDGNMPGPKEYSDLVKHFSTLNTNADGVVNSSAASKQAAEAFKQMQDTFAPPTGVEGLEPAVEGAPDESQTKKLDDVAPTGISARESRSISEEEQIAEGEKLKKIRTAGAKPAKAPATAGRKKSGPSSRLAATIQLMSKEKLQKYVKDAAKRKNVSEELVWAMINRELGE